MRAIVLVLGLALAGCGGDDDGGGDDGASFARPIPDSWTDGEHFGVVVLSEPRRDAVTFGEPVCTMNAQVVDATGSTGLPITDREGSCVVTAATSLADAPGLAAACPGDVTMRFGATSRRITLCGDTIAAPLEIGCDLIEPAMMLEASADGSGEIAGFTFMTTVPRPTGFPVVTKPEWQGEGTAVWPASGDLDVEWTAGGGAAMEIVLRPITGGAAVRCMSLDDGSFSVPERLLATLRTGTATMELTRIEQDEVDAGDYFVRVSYTLTDAIQIFVRR
jgi:hypothetical protein